jgi:hypothetical protein
LGVFFGLCADAEVAEHGAFGEKLDVTENVAFLGDNGKKTLHPFDYHD